MTSPAGARVGAYGLQFSAAVVPFPWVAARIQQRRLRQLPIERHGNWQPERGIGIAFPYPELIKRAGVIGGAADVGVCAEYR